MQSPSKARIITNAPQDLGANGAHYEA
ncbi:MAG: hypothetical protein RJB59_705, partial [Actinomycetota bacterium]